MTRRRWSAVVVAFAALLPFVVFRHTAVAPTTHLVAARADANPLDDPTLDATAIARAWARWERGDLSTVDDRVFSPAPNALACGEWFPLEAIVGYPFRALFDSIPAGINAPYYLALVTFPIVLYALYARLVGPGAIGAIAAFAVAYGPGRMNSLGVLNGIFTAFVILAVLAARDWVEKERARDLILFVAALVAQGLASLYGIAMGLVWAVPAFFLLAGRNAWRPRRMLTLAGAGLVAFGLLAVPYRPYFRIVDELGLVLARSRFDQHAADILSLLHGGIFGGPVRDVLEKLVPGFPLGAAAFFPTLAFTFAIVTWQLTAARRDRSPLPWLVLAGAIFLCALGPTIHVAGRPVGPGPYRLLTGLPVFSSLRGIHRYDQWFDISLGAAAALAIAAISRTAWKRGALATFVSLAALDAWPADIPSFSFPQTSAYTDAIRALPRGASIAIFPWSRDTCIQAWVDQLAHGRRVIDGSYTYPPALHAWTERVLPSLPVSGAFVLLRELGASVIAVDTRLLTPIQRAALAEPAPGALETLSVKEIPPFRLYYFEPKAPCLVDAAAPPPLIFRARTAGVSCRASGLVFRLGLGERPVLVRDPGRGVVMRMTLDYPIVSPPPMRVTLSADAPAGTTIEDAVTGRTVGRVEPP